MINTHLCGLLALFLAATGPVESIDSNKFATPRKALQSFLELVKDGQFAEASAALDLSSYPESERAERGLVLARQLKSVLEKAVDLKVDLVSNNSMGNPDYGEYREVLGTVAVGTQAVPIVLHGEVNGEGTPVWKFSANTVAKIPVIISELESSDKRGWLATHIPSFLVFEVLGMEAWRWLGLVIALCLSWILARVVGSWLFSVACSITRHTRSEWDDRLLGAVGRPATLFLGLLIFGWSLAPLQLPDAVRTPAEHMRSSLFLIASAWILTRILNPVCDLLIGRVSQLIGGDEGRKRGLHTQVVLLKRIAAVVIWVVAGSLVFLQFDSVRTVGMSLLASAGIAGIVVGLAAQRSISSLLAGIQLSLTQPIRIGDTVIVEGEWGWIEEIHLTYVVVKVWDLRRLIVPIQKFLENSFQNWTKVTPQIMGTVEIHADFTVPTDMVRKELTRICESHPLWDQRVCGLQVTAMSDRSLTLRALVSSEDASKNWDLRCDVREGLVKYLQHLEEGRYLPRHRLEGDLPSAAQTARQVA